MAKLHLFPQIARKIPREIVKAAEEKYKSNKGCQYLDVLTHLLSFLLCHLGDCQSLRDVCNAMKCFLPNLKELGIEKTPSRNALSHQNARRNPNVFREIYMRLVKHLGQQPLGRDEVSGIRSSRVVLLDSSVVTLCLSLFQWASYKEEKGAIKMHTLFSMRDFLPVDIYVSDGKKSDNEGAYHLIPNKRQIIVADRGYDDSALWKTWDSNGVTFVVRLRRDIQFDRLEEFDLPSDAPQHILLDEGIKLTGDETSQNYERPLRRVVVYRPYAENQSKRGISAYIHSATPDDKDDTIELVTNNAHLTATQVCELYKSRWNIESFFKTIKQNLRIKSFLGTNKNAVMSQIWCAMIALLLLRHLKQNAKYPWHMSNLVSLIRLAMFSTINLVEWLNNPLCLEQKDEENVAIDTS